MQSEEMLRDQREREQLEKNLKERDAAATRKVLDLTLDLASSSSC